MNRNDQQKGLPVNVNVENLTACKRLLRFEVDVTAVDAAFESTTKDFAKQAKLPGFRPGKAPKEMVARQFEKDIAEEVKRHLIGEAYRQGIKDQNLQVLGYPDIEEIHFERGQALQFAATVEIQPDFQLPEYRGLPARRESGGVTDPDVAKAIDALRERLSQFNTVERAVQAGDYVVVSYTGTCEGRPLTELAPTARGLTEQKNFWIEVKPESFIPGFAMQLVGAKAGDKRTVNIDFPTEFVSAPLAGKKGVYEVELIEVKEKVLPPLDDAFAQSYGADTVDRLQTGVRSDLQNEYNLTQKRSIRDQLVKELLTRVDFELPETTLQMETRNIVYEMVNENQQRGIAKELIEAEKDKIYSAAQGIARNRVKVGFLIQRIAEREGIRADQQEINARIAVLAASNKMAPLKFSQEMEKQGRLSEIYQQLIHEKVMTFLHENAKIEDVPPGTGVSQ
ncbi:MAG: trigger factor [Verrucomicrobiota bacterium]